MVASSNLTVPFHSNPRPLDLDQVEDLLKLQRAAQKINSILDLGQLVDKVVNEIARSFGCLDSDIYLHNEERGELSLVCAHGCSGCEIHGPGHSLKIGNGMVGYVASTGQMRYAPDVRLDDHYIGCEESTLSEVAIPLHVEGQLVGVFTASHTELDAFTPCQLRLLQALCSDVAVAVHNARRFQQEQRQRERMTSEAREARVIQQALFPKSVPSIAGFTVSGLFHRGHEWNIIRDTTPPIYLTRTGIRSRSSIRASDGTSNRQGTYSTAERLVELPFSIQP
jgi:phosphoserine phosphatase RsbU/P